MAVDGQPILRHSGVACPIMISCPGKACLKLDRCCRLENSQEIISLKPRAQELAVAKMDGSLIGISSFCSSHHKTSVNCPGVAQCSMPAWSLHRRFLIVCRAREWEKSGNGTKGEVLKSLLHWQCPGFYCWCWSLLTLFRKCCFSVVCIRAWKYLSVCICVGMVAFGNQDPKGFMFCWVLGFLQAFYRRC